MHLAAVRPEAPVPEEQRPAPPPRERGSRRGITRDDVMTAAEVRARLNRASGPSSGSSKINFLLACPTKRLGVGAERGSGRRV